MQEKPAVGVVAIIIVVAVTVGILMSGGKEYDPHEFDASVLWFYDLNTNEQYAVKVVGDFDMVPPHDAPSGALNEKSGPMTKGGAAGVRAWVFACGTCKDEQFLGYLETLEPKKRQNAIDRKVGYHEVTWHRAPDGDDWHKAGTPESEAIVDFPVNKCGDKRPQRCEVNDAPAEVRAELKL